MRKISRRTIAREVGISAPYLTLILNNKQEVGKGAARKMATLAGDPWVQYLEMDTDLLEEVLRNAVQKKREAGDADIRTGLG